MDERWRKGYNDIFLKIKARSDIDEEETKLILKLVGKFRFAHIKKNNKKNWCIVRKIMQYLPFSSS